MCVVDTGSNGGHWLLLIVRPQVPMWWLGDAVVVVVELDAVVVVAGLKVPMRG